MTLSTPNNSRITYTKEMITPESARYYLDLMRGNRSLNKDNVASLARQMREGQWKDYCSEIRFNVDGELIDGQHRLNAVIKSDTCQHFTVIRGYELGHYIFDSGKTRSTQDVLTLINGKKITKSCADSAKLAMRLPQNMKFKPTDNEVADFYEEHEVAVIFSAKKASRSAKNQEIGLIAPFMSLLLKAFYYESQKDLKEFINIFKTGVASDGIGHPVLALRRDFDFNKSKYTKESGMPDFYYKVQKALRAFVAGEKLDKITLGTKDKKDYYPL